MHPEHGADPQEIRAQTIHHLAHCPVDVLIIGGGIVGAGIARDAAMRGLKVGLVEQHDFAFGTSSRSSRLLHGGLRYLAQGRVGLVHQASVEKKIIHKIAPHLTQPLSFLFPTYRESKDWILWQLKVGVKLYDLLCHGQNFARSTWWSKSDVLERVPALAPTGLTGAVRYFDGFTNDARLVIDTLRSAARYGAHLLNYCRFQGSLRADGWRCTLEDRLASGTFEIQAHAVVNATGPWSDGLPHSRVKLRLTKGVHLIVDRARLAVPDTIVMTEGKRILFAIPWGDRTILGTTDTDYMGSLDTVTADAGDVRHVLEVTNRFFPSAQLRPEDVISTWAGLRPLIADRSGKPSDISRSHEIRSPEADWWDVAGGKLTTYRLMAEQTVDRVVQSLRARGLSLPVSRCRTAEEALLPSADILGVSGILPPDFSRGVVEHGCRREWAAHLSDVMLRRTSWHYYYADASDRAEQVADWMGDIFRWPEERRKAELQHYRDAAAAPVQNPPSEPVA